MTDMKIWTEPDNPTRQTEANKLLMEKVKQNHTYRVTEEQNRIA